MKAVQAIHQAPGVLAVDVNYEKGMATVGTEPGSPVPREAILEAIRGIGYQGEFVDQE